MFELPKLNFNPEDLKGFMSEETIKFHYKKHHQAYADKANEAIKGSAYEDMTLEDIIKKSYKKDAGVFNNSAQFYNHNLFWEILDSSIGKAITPEFEVKISESFGSFEKFKEEFCELAVSQFGSGWVWLIKNKDGSLELSKTSNAENPLIHEQTPLMTCDVWEHAYYLDYQNRRAEFVKNFLDHLVNWKTVEQKNQS